MKRITKAALGGLAGCAMIIGATQAANGEPPLEFSSRIAVPLVSMSSSEPSAAAFLTNPAEVNLEIKQAPEATNFKITVNGIIKAATNPVHGAHLHVGPCPQPGGTDTTSGHYKDDKNIGVAVAENEVWFDLETNIFGTATDSTTAKFVPVDGDGVMSIVIHAHSAELPTSQSAKLACFPLEVTDDPDWDLI